MKKVLIITYYWPPAGGPGVQRWVQFVKHFKSFGITPVVYAPQNPHYPLKDATFLKDVPEDVEVIKKPIKEPYKWAKLFSKKHTQKMSSGLITSKKQSVLSNVMRFIRGNFFIPDARVGWVTPSVNFLSNYLIENRIETIITTGPPHSLHLIGLQLKKKINCKWIADFRDPWTTIHYHKSLRLTKASEKKHKQLESSVLNSADTVTVTSSVTKKEFQELTTKPIEVITNGYDASIKVTPTLDSKFTIAHIGSLLAERNPIMLWEVLSEIISEDEAFKEDFELKLVGAVSDEISSSLAQFGLANHCNFVGYVTHKEAIQLQHNAQVLLLIEIDSVETKAIIPGKLFEYIAAQRPIIAIGPSESDIQHIITETNSGSYFSYNAKEALKKSIINYYTLYKKKELKVKSSSIAQYSRKNLTQQMAQLIKQL